MVSEDSDQCVHMQADLSLCWSHKCYCRFCHALAHMHNDVNNKGTLSSLIRVFLVCQYNQQ